MEWDHLLYWSGKSPSPARIKQKVKHSERCFLSLLYKWFRTKQYHVLDKDLGHFWLGYIRIMLISWDICYRVLTLPILEGSKIALNGLIDLIKKPSPNNSVLAVNLQSDFEGSGVSKYLEICPNFALKEHYIPEPHCNLSWIVWNTYVNTNPFMYKLLTVRLRNNMHFALQIFPHWLLWRIQLIQKVVDCTPSALSWKNWHSSEV